MFKIGGKQDSSTANSNRNIDKKTFSSKFTFKVHTTPKYHSDITTIAPSETFSLNAHRPSGDYSYSEFYTIAIYYIVYIFINIRQPCRAIPSAQYNIPIYSQSIEWVITC